MSKVDLQQTNETHIEELYNFVVPSSLFSFLHGEGVRGDGVSGLCLLTAIFFRGQTANTIDNLQTNRRVTLFVKVCLR